VGVWSEIWKALGVALAQLPVGWQLAMGLGAGLLLLASLEGLHLLLFPRRVLNRLAGRYPAGQAEPEPEIVQPRPQPMPISQAMQAASSDAPRRWQRPERARPKSLAARRRPQN
jgi:hypothetical protein